MPICVFIAPPPAKLVLVKYQGNQVSPKLFQFYANNNLGLFMIGVNIIYYFTVKNKDIIYKFFKFEYVYINKKDECGKDNRKRDKFYLSRGRRFTPGLFYPAGDVNGPRGRGLKMLQETKKASMTKSFHYAHTLCNVL